MTTTTTLPETPSWGVGWTQNDMMEKDTVLVLDERDNVIGSASKKTSHVFNAQQPHGILHRAFSVFVFERQSSRMLLQQRAHSKITFPNVWTNTCCSHPLHGMDPNEVDTPADVADGSVRGVKHAAMRKLQHELGIDPALLDLHGFRFLTRLHYWAADTVTHGPDAPWGEHEIDYVLFYVVDKIEALPLLPHPEEVDDTRWVTLQELQTMMRDDNLLFSPWFRLIVEKWLETWWQNLDVCMRPDPQQNPYLDYQHVHLLDPPAEHCGGAGGAGPLFAGQPAKIHATPGDATKKQGAYGKVVTHQESKLVQLGRVDEVWAALTLLYVRPLRSNLDAAYIRQIFPADDLAFCDDILVHVSRSFAAVIRQLPDRLLVDILVFYLVLRALDTIEDDTTAFASPEEKIDYLLNFHRTALADPDWNLQHVGQGDERRLLQQFPQCHRVYAKLAAPSRRVVADVTARMATGMAEFVRKDLGQGTTNTEQYNRYCHFVAGLVGEGLSRLFAASGLEAGSFAGELHLSDQMGLFLQKTNIIRDYLEDYVDQRAFWPQSVWKKYAATDDLGYFAQSIGTDDGRDRALGCLNELVTDALELVPDCLTYLARLQCQEIFRFCAIPQVMAIATLDKCYHNVNVFTGVVKIRKGLSCKLLLRTNTLSQVHETFYTMAQSIRRQAQTAQRQGFVDPSHARTVRICDTILELTAPLAVPRIQSRHVRVWGAAVLGTLAWAVPHVRNRRPSTDRPGGLLVQSTLWAAAAAWYFWPIRDKSRLQPAAALQKAKSLQ
jgi:farnesyl-diphosphate farnesyltransferase/isopentenyl-diphosphate delta-isomerase type 1